MADDVQVCPALLCKTNDQFHDRQPPCFDSPNQRSALFSEPELTPSEATRAAGTEDSELGDDRVAIATAIQHQSLQFAHVTNASSADQAETEVLLRRPALKLVCLPSAQGETLVLKQRASDLVAWVVGESVDEGGVFTIQQLCQMLCNWKIMEVMLCEIADGTPNQNPFSCVALPQLPCEGSASKYLPTTCERVKQIVLDILTCEETSCSLHATVVLASDASAPSSCNQHLRLDVVSWGP
mmetsp:Transcript_43237/g.136525  ORF Transcript_43237/g.136525 Transcript_43237/m.136525 type:complete len:240 (+) Transcript_43237:830-1549(+)